MAKKKAAKKTKKKSGKKRASKYESKLKIHGTFSDVLKVSIPPPKNKEK
jgi:hypothetical protein